MGFDNYAVLGMRNSNLSEKEITELLSKLQKTCCATRKWIKWHGPHVDFFDAILKSYGDRAEFVRFLIGEEGNLLEVTVYEDGKAVTSEYKLLTLEVFTGYSHSDLLKLPSKQYEKWIESYDKYRRKTVDLAVTQMKLHVLEVEELEDR